MGWFLLKPAPVEDTTPDAFDFVNVEDADLSTPYESALITILGVNAPVPLLFNNGLIKINGGVYVPYGSAPATGNLNDTIQLSLNSSASNSAAEEIDYVIGTAAGTWSVTTEAAAPDVTAPTISTLSPVDGAADVLVGFDPVAIFDEPVVFGSSVDIELRNSGGLVEAFDETHIGTKITLTSGNTLTIIPTADMDVSEAYHVLITAGSVEDAAGNPFAGIASATTWNWVTEAESLATLTTPTLDLQAGSDLGTSSTDNITSDASPDMDATFGDLEEGDLILVKDNDVEVDTHEVTGGEAGGSLISLAFPPLSAGSHSITIQQFRGAEYSDTSTPLVIVVDTVAPTLVSTSPTDDGANVTESLSPTATFSKDIAFGTGNIELRKTSDDSLVEAFNVATEQGAGNGQVSITDEVLTINPTTNFAASTSYYFLIDATAITGLSGIPFTGIASKTTWNFATTDVAPPNIVTLSPADNATDVIVSNSLTVTYDEAIAFAADVTVFIKETSDDSVVFAFTEADIGVALTISGNVLTITPPTNLPDEIELYVQIFDDSIEDTSGNPSNGITSTTGWSFTTGTRLDQDTYGWVQAVITAGGTVSTTQEDRVDALVLALKAAGLFTKLDRMWLWAGESVVQQANIDIINLAAINTATNGGTLAAGGWTGNGTSNYVNLLVAPSGLTQFTQNACSFGVYDRTNTTAGGQKVLIGSITGGTYTYIEAQNDNFNINATSVFPSITTSTTQGFWCAVRTSSVDTRIERNGTQVGSSGANTSSSRPTHNFYVSAYNLNGTAGRFSADQIALVFLGGALDSTEAQGLYDAVQAYMTAWGVNV